ncbi:MAG: DUF3793 family protein [Faecalibacillus sp.]
MSNEFEKELIFYAAPTLSKMKMANLYNVHFYYLDQYLLYYNHIFNKKDIYLMKFTIQNRNILYVYQKRKLDSLYHSRMARKILHSFQYQCLSPESMLQELQKRLNNQGFPHEIGLFLGYPYQDVLSFINGKKPLFIGYWKVYSHLNQCQKTFLKYEKCTRELYRRLKQGMTIEQICQYI